MQGRPPKADRDEIKRLYVSVKLTPAERDEFDRVLELRAAELRRLTGEEFNLTASDLLRRLIAKEAERLGVRPAANKSKPTTPPEPEPPAPTRSPPKTSPSKASAPKGKPSKGRGR